MEFWDDVQGRREKPRAVWQSLTAFIVLTMALFGWGCEAIAPSSPPPTSQETASQEATSQQQLTTPLPVLYPSAALRLSQPGGFNQRYVQWLVNFESLQALVEEFNQLPGLNQPVQLQVTSCDGLDSFADGAMPTDLRNVQLCYELLAYLSDQFDDLSASPREQQLATLDAVYLLTLRQLSQIALSDYSLPVTSDTLDEVTVALPHILNQPSADTVLSGAQWIFNQGHPLGVETGLYQFFEPLVSEVSDSDSLPLTVQSQSVPLAALQLDNYERMICYAHRIAPQLYPYLASEIPNTLDLSTCTTASANSASANSASATPLEQWRERFQGDGNSPWAPSSVLPTKPTPQPLRSAKPRSTE